MLESLDDIPWGNLEHAYGTAEDVPKLIRQLADDDPLVRHETMSDLYGNVFHQGTRYPATPYVIPFLQELCESPAVAERGELLQFWGALITGYFNVRERPIWGDGTTIYFLGEKQEAEADDPYNIALHEIYRNSLHGESLLYELLGSADDAIRAGAAFVLACLPTLKSRSIPRLREQLALDASGFVKGAITFALGEVGDAETVRGLLNRNSEHPAARCMAACELARIDPRPELLAELLQFVGEPIPSYENIPGAGGESTGDAAAAINDLPRELQQQAIPAIIEQLERARSFATMPFVRTLLSAAFEPRETPVAECDPLQRHVLLSLLNAQEIWSIGNLYSEFRYYGLPHDRTKCAALLGVNVVADRALSELSIAVTFAHMGFLEKARSGIETALGIDPAVFARIAKPDECWLYCAKAFAETDVERALQAYDNATAINPRIAARVGVDWQLREVIARRE